jgi:hypothetical protein
VVTGCVSMRRLLLCGLAGLAASNASAQPVRVIDRVPIDRPAGLAGPKLAELSGLAWDAQREELVAVSDKGAVFRIAIKLDAGRLQAATVRRADRIGAAGDPKINAETVVAQGEGRWWVSDEARHDLVQIDERGSALGRAPLPGRLGDPARLAQGNSGIEAMASHPQHGRLLVPQRPLRDTPAGIHHVVAEDGSVFALRADARAPSRIKAADAPVEGELLLIEKLKLVGGDRVQLRRMKLADCPESRPCDPPAWAVEGELADGLNLEGLACIGPRLCLLVNDDGPPAPPGSWLLLVELPVR